MGTLFRVHAFMFLLFANINKGAEKITAAGSPSSSPALPSLAYFISQLFFVACPTP